MKRNSGFTLVEILIVVIILGILAAIVIPQFTEASNDARVSAMVSDLQTVRSQIELYKIQHLDAHPGTAVDGTTWAIAAFKTQLMGRTDNKGTAVAVGTVGALGPYLQKFPTNAYVGTNEIGTGKAWTYDSTTGAFAPADSDHSGM